MDSVVLPPIILTNDADVEFWLDEYSISNQYRTPLYVTMIERCRPNILTERYSQTQSYVPETVKEQNKDHHTKAQLYDPNPSICALANSYSDMYEELNDCGEDDICSGETMAFHGDKTNLNSDDDHLMSDDTSNNDNYNTMSQLMCKEKVGIVRGK
ncbi:hypothetical protein TorRG33x02_138450 [Trema orientale]|uniref:Uncharacterized protein n=1 Tax=Trema orientale TaxID=63057 RepID=A0A2P5EXW7_TREOI|nr:hypothetical protein TorRG33x02_138450 [Trema orientale]